MLTTISAIDDLLASADGRDSFWHGETHWRAVAQAGWYLADADPRVDLDVVLLFAVMHDSRRENEYKDPKHGQRAARRFRLLHGSGLFPVDLTAAQSLTLESALYIHNGAPPNSNPTVAACLDADRLQYWRVGQAPDPALLSTPFARRPSTRAWTRRLCYVAHNAGLPRIAPHPDSPRLLTWTELGDAYRVLDAHRFNRKAVA